MKGEYKGEGVFLDDWVGFMINIVAVHVSNLVRSLR